MKVAYDVFIDESGLFTETSVAPADRIAEHGRGKKFASQLAGIIAPQGRFSLQEAKSRLQPAFEEINQTAHDVFHSTDLKKQGRGLFDRFLTAACESLRQTRAQAFRIVNQERVSFGDRKANYVNIAAELLLQLAAGIELQKDDSLVLNIFQAGIRDSEYEDTDDPLWSEQDFLPGLRIAFQRAAIARGWGKDSGRWRLGNFKFLSGLRDPRIWWCDLISNASHDNFGTIGQAARNALKEMLGDRDFTLSINLVIEQVRQLSEREAFGAAIVELAENSLSSWTTQEARVAYLRELSEIVPKLFALPPSILVPQLQVILGWLRQFAENRQYLLEARQACRWIEERVVKKHTELIEPTLASWLRLGIATAGLTACNHGADLKEGRVFSEQIDAIIPDLVGRWEHVSDLMQALVVQAVHDNDRFEHGLVVEKMQLVAGYYRSLGSFFHEVYPNMFPEVVHSNLCGQALGTLVQAETFLLHNDAANVDDARASSDAAIEQFALLSDRQRQYQYRSEIEAIACDWDAARSFLAQGIGCESTDHAGIALYIASLDEKSRLFPLLHWTRIGGMAATKDADDEHQCFFDAWQTHSFEEALLRDGGAQQYPVHGILRRLASVYAKQQNEGKTLHCLRSLRAVVGASPSPLFQLIEAAAILQAAGLIGIAKAEKMHQWLLESKEIGLTGLLRNIQVKATQQPRLAGIAKNWEDALSAPDARTSSPQKWIVQGSLVGY